MDCTDSQSLLTAGYVLALFNIYQRINYLGSDYLGPHICAAAPIPVKGKNKFFEIFSIARKHTYSARIMHSTKTIVQ